MSDIELFQKFQSLPLEFKQQVEELIVRLSSMKGKKQNKEVEKRPFGVLKGKIEILPGFDDPLEDFAEYQ